VTFPTAGRYTDACKGVLLFCSVITAGLTFSLTDSSKFFSPATLTAIQPSFSASVETLYVTLGTAEMTTSERARHSSKVNLQA